MKRPTFWEIMQALAVAALFAVIAYELWSTQEDCEQRRGTLVRTMSGYECVNLERK